MAPVRRPTRQSTGELSLQDVRRKYDEIRQRPRIMREETLSLIRQFFQKDEVEVQTKTVSLVCPLSKRRIQDPVRGSRCRHIECLDLQSHLDYHTNLAYWECPFTFCREQVGCDQLRVDEYTFNVLRDINDSVLTLKVLSDGTFQAVQDPTPSTVTTIDDDGASIGKFSVAAVVKEEQESCDDNGPPDVVPFGNFNETAVQHCALTTSSARPNYQSAADEHGRDELVRPQEQPTRANDQQLQSAEPSARVEEWKRVLSQPAVQLKLKHQEAVNASYKRKRERDAATSDGDEPVFKSHNAGHATDFERLRTPSPSSSKPKNHLAQNAQEGPVDRTESKSDPHLAKLTLNIKNWNRNAKRREQSIQNKVNKEGLYSKKAAGKPKMEAKWEANRQKELAKFHGRHHLKSQRLRSEITVRIVYRALTKHYSVKHGISSFADHFREQGHSGLHHIVSHAWSIEKEEDRNALFHLCVKTSPNDFIECPWRYDEWRAHFDCRQKLDEFLVGLTKSVTARPPT